MNLTIESTTKLNNGIQMPWFGLGVYQSEPGKETQQAVECALENNYRHIDTAALYSNETDVGLALNNSGLKRESIFITTKLWNSDHGYDNTLRACERSLKNLGLDFLDLYLIHWPVQDLREESWKAMERLYEEGICKAVGVSNYYIHHLEEVLNSCNIVPAVNQVEQSPYLYKKDLIHFCQSNQIQMEAYSPLTRGQKLQEPFLVEMAKKYDKSSAQLLIRWCLQNEMVVIPKSVNPARIRANAEVFDFEISTDDMDVLNGLNEDLHTCWNPENAP